MLENESKMYELKIKQQEGSLKKVENNIIDT